MPAEETAVRLCGAALLHQHLLVWDLTGHRRWSNNLTPVGKYQRQDESYWCYYEDAGPFMGLL
jgi:hypothetical protein